MDLLRLESTLKCYGAYDVVRSCNVDLFFENWSSFNSLHFFLLESPAWEMNSEICKMYQAFWSKINSAGKAMTCFPQFRTGCTCPIYATWTLKQWTADSSQALEQDLLSGQENLQCRTSTSLLCPLKEHDQHFYFHCLQFSFVSQWNRQLLVQQLCWVIDQKPQHL